MDNIKLRTIKDLLPIITTISAIFAVFANLWVFSKLSPLLQSDAVIVQRVEAIENSELVPRKELDSKFDSINTRIDDLDKNIGKRFDDLTKIILSR